MIAFRSDGGRRLAMPEESSPGAAEHFGFVEDVQWAMRALRSNPAVVLVSLSLALLPPAIRDAGMAAQGILPLLINWGGVIVILAMLGWFGAERIFFLAHREGRSVSIGHLFRLVPSFAARYLTLALICGIPLSVFGILTGVTFGTE